jgi:signal transduction histidine kinase
MRVRIWPFVCISFSVLLLLVPLFAWIVSREAAQIDLRARQAHSLYQKADDAITEIRTSVYNGALLVKSASTEQAKASAARKLAEIRSSTTRDMDTLSSLLDKTQQGELISLRHGLDEYWNSVAQSLTALERDGERPAAESRSDQREKVLELAEQIDSLNSANLNQEEQQIQTQQHALRQSAAGATILLFVLGLVISIASTFYLARLERTSERQRVRAENAEFELRRLSNQLVRAQEDERRLISRELHDEVGQVLTGLRMELGSLTQGSADAGFRKRLDSVKGLAEEALRTVRNLALLLRPSMLDDLGIGPALRWQAKEFSRRSGIPVSIDIQGNLDALPESFRICLYRVIQEALTNCAKHAEASRVTVTIRQERDLVSASVQDNGKGFEAERLRTGGLGLIGMEERVRALQGTLSVSSIPGGGTTVQLDLPLLAEDRVHA